MPVEIITDFDPQRDYMRPPMRFDEWNDVLDKIKYMFTKLTINGGLYDCRNDGELLSIRDFLLKNKMITKESCKGED